MQPGGLFDAPDLSGSAGASQCGTRVTVSFDVQNRGAARVTPGVNVTLYHVQSGGTRAALATVQTTTTIDPGQSETVTFDVPRPAGVGNNQSIDLVVVVDDDGSGNGAINECDEMNNETALAPLPCKSIN